MEGTYFAKKDRFSPISGWAARQSRTMAAETALRPILTNGTLMPTHRPNVHTMVDGPTRWFCRKRRAGWEQAAPQPPSER